MKRDVGSPPESVIKALSNPNETNVAGAIGGLLKWSDSGRDETLHRRSIQLMRQVMRSLREALPNTAPELIGSMCAHLFDLWETGQALDKRLKEVRGMRFPRDYERLRGVLKWTEAIQLDMASFWAGEVKKDLPKLLDALDRQQRNGRPRMQRKPKARRLIGKAG